MEIENQTMMVVPSSVMTRVLEKLETLEKLLAEKESDTASFDIARAAEYCGCKISTLHKLTSNGELAYIKGVGKGNTFLKRDLDALRTRLRVPSNRECRQ